MNLRYSRTYYLFRNNAGYCKSRKGARCELAEIECEINKSLITAKYDPFYVFYMYQAFIYLALEKLNIQLNT